MSGSLFRRLSVRPFGDSRGALCVWEQQRHVPYRIARTYFMYEVPGGIHRGDHAHRRLERTLVALAGAADLVLDDGRRRQALRLDDPAEGIYVPPMVWTDLHNFTPGTVVMCLASLAYDEADYIRDKQVFLKEISAQWQSPSST
ncbi:MAG: FdtA/QdtA family cupin domain-containing protein [Reyranellaceae bacterium]